MHAYIDMAHFNTDLVSIFCKSNHGMCMYSFTVTTLKES